MIRGYAYVIHGCLLSYYINGGIIKKVFGDSIYTLTLTYFHTLSKVDSDGTAIIGGLVMSKIHLLIIKIFINLTRYEGYIDTRIK